MYGHFYIFGNVAPVNGGRGWGTVKMGLHVALNATGGGVATGGGWPGDRILY